MEFTNSYVHVKRPKKRKTKVMVHSSIALYCCNWRMIFSAIEAFTASLASRPFIILITKSLFSSPASAASIGCFAFKILISHQRQTLQ